MGKHENEDLQLAADVESLMRRLQTRRRAENRLVGTVWVGRRDGDETTLGYQYTSAIDAMDCLSDALRSRARA